MKLRQICLISFIIALELTGQILGVFEFGSLEDLHVREKRYGDDDSRCYDGVNACFITVNKYKTVWDGIERSKALRASGPNQTCSDYLRTFRCALDVISTCPGYSEVVTELCQQGLKIYEYECLTKARDTTQHWNCLTNVDVAGGFRACDKRLYSLSDTDNDCNHEEISECMIKIASKTEDCEPTSHKYLSDLVAEIEKIKNPNCRANSKMFW